jgi:hypothetical protein
MSATPPPGLAEAPFTDARGCREWLATLPLTNVAQVQVQVLEVLRALAGGALAALEHLKCIELMRDKIAFLQGEQRSRYFGKMLPLSANEERAWNAGRLVLEEMEVAYRRSLRDAAALPELQRHLALVSQRIARCIGTQMLFHMAIYRRFDPALWTRLHQLYADAESRGYAEERIKDSLDADESGTTVAETYAQVVLLQAAYLSELTAPQIDFADALLKMWARKVAIRRALPDGTLPPSVHALVVDFEKPIGARPLPPRDVTSHHRILDVEGLSASLRRRIHGLRKDEDIASLKLPAQAAAVDALAQMERLHRLWCEGAPPRPSARVPEEKAATLAFGPGEIHFFLTEGKPFEQPDRTRELTSREKQDIEVFGQVSSRTATLMVSEFMATSETWGVIDEMLGAWRLMRPPNATKGLAIGRLLALQLQAGAPFFLGMVSALVQETDGRIVITVLLYPGKPEPVAVRADSRGRSPGKWQEGFRLPALARLNVPSSLIVPSGLATRGRSVETWEGAPQRHGVSAVLDRGTDFDRIAIE